MSNFRHSSGELKEVPPSIMERLRSGGVTDRAATDLRVDIEGMRAEVLRHVQALLNTRLAQGDELEGFPEARNSLLSYGVPDLSSYFHGNDTDTKRLTSSIERAIRMFEPRLDPQSLRVESIADKDDSRLHKRLRIHAVMRVHPFRSQIQFDTRIEIDTGAVVVKEQDA